MEPDDQSLVSEDRVDDIPMAGLPDDKKSIEQEEGRMKEDSPNDDSTTSSSSLKVSFNYINSIIGSGVIGMPFAFKEAGIGAGIVILFFVAWITDYSLILMMKGALSSGAKSYQELMEKSFGAVGFYTVTIIQFAYPLIAMVSYNVIFGDTVTKVLVGIFAIDKDSIWVSREFVTFLATVFLTLPISLYRNITKLSKISLISLLLICFIAVSVFIRLGDYSVSTQNPSSTLTFIRPSGLVQAIGIMTFALMCHHNSFLLYQSMENPSIPKWKSVTHISIFVSVTFMILFALGGYFTFNDAVQGDLFNNYCWSDSLMNLSRVLFSITIMLTYPIECFVCREVFLSVIYQGGEDLVQNMDSKKAYYNHIYITLFIVLLTYLLSLTTDCLGIVLELNGLIAAVPLAFLFPALTFIKLSEGSLFTREKIPAILIIIFAITVIMAGIVTLSARGPEKCDHIPAMEYCIKSNISTEPLAQA